MPRSRLRSLRLAARAVEPSPPPEWTATETADYLNITPPTLRDWVRRGLPQYGTAARPRYRAPEAIWWSLCYRDRIARREPVDHLSMREAWRFRDRFDLRTDPDHHVLVPLEWDHPERAERLRIAAEGIDPRKASAVGP